MITCTTTTNNKSIVRKKTIDYFNINSFCSVVTTEVKKEAHILAVSLNKIYRTIPIVFYCDKETFLYFQDFRIPNLVLTIVDFNEPNKVTKHNDYHKTCAICRKMDVMEFAIKRYGNTLFLDCDIIPLAPFIGPYHCDIALSLNLSVNCESAYQYVKNDGLFNAGMVWSSSIEFVTWWRDKYISGDSLFYEQECLNKVYAIKESVVDYFDNNHNHGFWRGTNLQNKRLLSIHCHLDSIFIRSIKDIWINQRLSEHRRSSLDYIKQYHRELYLEIINILL
jgi:hypothetical protein